MEESTLSEDWQALMAYLPDLEESASRHRFTRRSTGRQSAQSWLRLILMHAAGGLSLVQTVSRAAAHGWISVSAVALHKRLRAASPWLEALTAHLLAGQQRLLGGGGLPEGRSLRVVDAADIQEPGSTGTDWRLHYSLRLPQLVCDHFEFTDARQAEQLARFCFQPGEIVLADRGYCHRSGVTQVLDARADVVVRLIAQNFPLQDASGRAFSVLERLSGMKVGSVKEWKVWFEHDGWLRPLRVCVMRKPEAAAQEERSRLRRRTSRSGVPVREQSWRGAAYVMLLTSLPAQEWDARRVLELYRCRWQVELAFKRLKTLLRAGHVPKSSDPTAKAWMQAKILTALLVETLLMDSGSFSPWSGRLGQGIALVPVQTGA